MISSTANEVGINKTPSAGFALDVEGSTSRFDNLGQAVPIAIFRDNNVIKLTVADGGDLQGSQVTSGTMNTWRVPTGIANALPTKPTCATSVNAGQIIYVDDSNDTAVAMLCVCRADADDTTYSWVQISDNTSACL